MNLTPAEYQKHLDKLNDFRSVEAGDPEYYEKIKALKAKRLKEKSQVPEVERDPSKDYRWCDPRSERFPYKVAEGWIPVMKDGRLVCDNELILCSRERAVNCGAAEEAEFVMLPKETTK